MFPKINYRKQFLRKNIKTKYFFTMCPQSRKKDDDYVYAAYKENLSSCVPS